MNRVSIALALSSPAVKALVADFLLTLSTTLVVLNVAPASFRDLFDMGAIVSFAVFKSAAQSFFRGALKWASA